MKRNLKTLAQLATFIAFGGVQHLSAGMITNTAFVDGPLTFTSTWLWTFAGGVGTLPVTVAGANWEVTLQGFANGDLRDTSRHLTNPHLPPEIAPNVLSFFHYAGAAAGIVPVPTAFGHPAIPGHFDRYVMTTLPLGPLSTIIGFDGEHLGQPPQPPVGSRTAIPEPATFLLLSAGLGGLLGAVRLRRR